MISAHFWSVAEQKCRQFSGTEALDFVRELRSTENHCWLDLQAPSDAELDAVFGAGSPIHTLTRDDLIRQRRDPDGRPHFPKVEEFADYLFVVVNPLIATRWPDVNSDEPLTTQLGAVLTHSRLVTCHEHEIPAIDELKSYLDRHEEQGHRGPDFLFHVLLNFIVDEYAPLLDGLVDRLDELEEEIFHDNTKDTLPRLLHLKRRLTISRKTLTYEREVLARLSRGEFELIDERETAYYRNVYDHLVRFTELAEGGREMVADLLQSHLSVVSNRLNEVMKVLTMISTIVLPMSVVTGIYGMNFDFMPELKWPWGYPMALGLIALAGLAPLAFFKWRKWI